MVRWLVRRPSPNPLITDFQRNDEWVNPIGHFGTSTRLAATKSEASTEEELKIDWQPEALDKVCFKGIYDLQETARLEDYVVLQVLN